MRRLLLAALALTLGAAGVSNAPQTAASQAAPPTRFYGKLTIDGQPAPAGKVVRAFIGTTDCTSPTSLTVPAGSYTVDVAGGGQISGCGSDGATVVFRVDGRQANESGTFTTGTFVNLDLTVTGAGGTQPTPTPTGQRFAISRLDFNSPCIPTGGAARCDDTRQKLWNGDAATWTAREQAAGRPAPTPDQVFILTYEYRLLAADPAAIRSLAQGLGWPKVYITAIRYRGTAAGEADEFIEIQNVGGASQDMTGWRALAVESNTSFFFTEGSVLNPGAVCRFYTGAAREDSCPGSVNLASSGVWNDNAGRAQLWYDPLALLADETRYAADSNSQPPPLNLQGAPN